MIDVNLREIHIVMAIGAFIGGLRMIDRLALRQGFIVTADTGGRRAFENATIVAGFAGYFYMLARKGKARGLVVEILVNLDG